jgi:3-deoxy-D-manno-octulosonate cytidylyltransferase
MQVVIVIPARYGSTRLPGKPLLDIAGKPMIQHVVERAQQVQGVHDVVVATDDIRIVQAVEGFGGRALITSPDHPSGTDRLIEVMPQVPADLYINLQGDEPLIRPGDIEKLIHGMMDHPSAEVGTLCHPITADEAHNPNSVKLVVDAQGFAVYFSRSLIPYPRAAQAASYLKHVGIYAYKKSVLTRYSQLVQPMIEQAEQLEQLRLLWAGIQIKAFDIEPTPTGVDTPECLDKVRQILSGAQIE